MERSDYAILNAAIRWRSTDAEHVDHRYLGAVGPLRDCLPGQLGACLESGASYSACRESFSAGRLVPPVEGALVRTIDRRLFKSRPRPRIQVVPQVGRFYPMYFLENEARPASEERRPFRILSMDDQRMIVDANHPLAGFPLEFEARVERWVEAPADPAVCPDVTIRLTAGGPGMQAELREGETDFYSNEPFSREDAAKDTEFYRTPRLVQHIDSQARACISDLYARFLQPGMRVLDLMTSWVSHLPEDAKDFHVVGLGLNREELDANPQLSDRVMHDLNVCPRMPFDEAAFDLVICTVSVEYLVRPVEVFTEVARVLKPGGKLVITFSDRWFPTKAIRLWIELNPFERVGLVLSYLRQSGGFRDLKSETWRGWPRPQDDKYAGQLDLGDPVFAAWATRV